MQRYDDGADRRRRPERLRRPAGQPVGRPAASAVVPHDQRRDRDGGGGGRARRRHPGLASRVDAALREGRRHLAGPLRRPRRGAPSSIRPSQLPTTRHGSARAPTARTATPASRCATRRPARRCRPSSTGCSATAGIERVVVVGLATDYCVKATALDAVRLGYETARADRRDRGGRPQAGRRRPGDRRRCARPASCMWQTRMR